MWCSAVSLLPIVFSAPSTNTQLQELHNERILVNSLEIRRRVNRACWALGGFSVCIMAKVNAHGRTFVNGNSH